MEACNLRFILSCIGVIVRVPGGVVVFVVAVFHSLDTFKCFLFSLAHLA